MRTGEVVWADTPRHTRKRRSETSFFIFDVFSFEYAEWRAKIQGYRGVRTLVAVWRGAGIENESRRECFNGSTAIPGSMNEWNYRYFCPRDGRPRPPRIACDCTRGGRGSHVQVPFPRMPVPAFCRCTWIWSADACKKSGS